MPARVARWAFLFAGLGLAACTQTGTLALSNQPEIVGHLDGLEVGHRLMEAGNYDLALTAYTKSVSQRGLTPDVLSALGSANLKLGRLGQAERYLEEAVAADEGYVAAWNNLGVVYINKAEHSRAETAFRAAFMLDNGQSAEIWQNLLMAIEQVKNEDLRAPGGPEAFSLMRGGNGRFLLLETPDK